MVVGCTAIESSLTNPRCVGLRWFLPTITLEGCQRCALTDYGDSFVLAVSGLLTSRGSDDRVMFWVAISSNLRTSRWNASFWCSDGSPVWRLTALPLRY